MFALIDSLFDYNQNDMMGGGGAAAMFLENIVMGGATTVANKPAKKNERTLG